MQHSSVADGGICCIHLSEALAQGSDGIERLVVDEGSLQVDLGEEGEVVEELDEEARLDGGAAGEVEAEQVVTLLLKRSRDAQHKESLFLKAKEDEMKPVR